MNLRVVSVATTRERLGSSHYARKLNAALGITTIPSETPLRTLLRLIRDSQPQICHIQFEYRTFGGAPRTVLLLPLLTFLVSRRCPVVITLHGVVEKESSSGRLAPLDFWVYRAMVRWTAKFATRLVVLAERMRVALESGYGLHRVTVIPHGSDAFPDLPVRASKPCLLFFGFLRPSKGIQELVEAFTLIAPEFPDLTLVIAGAAAKAEEQGFVVSLKRQILEHPFRDRIRQIDEFVSLEESHRLARDASIIVLPYKDRFVEISGVVHEVAASGAPILCSRIPRFEELIDGVEALHVRPDARSIAEGVRQILRDGDLRSRLSVGIRELARRESWEEVARLHAELFERIAGRDTAAH